MKCAVLTIAGMFLSLSLFAHPGHERVLVTQHNERVRFYSDVLSGKVVLISFLFTRCTDSCPMQTAKLAQVQSLLSGWMGSTIRFVSISVDPETDRPEVLREYAERFHAGKGWLFLTGERRDIEDVVGRLGQSVAAPETHTSLFIAGDLKAGRWLKLHSDMPPLEIAEQLRNLVREPS